MNIRTRLAVRFTLIVASLIIVFAIAIYYFSSTHRQKEFYERLKEKADNYAQLVDKLDALDPGLVKIFDKNTAYLPSERIVVYDQQNRQLFNTMEDSFTSEISF